MKFLPKRAVAAAMVLFLSLLAQGGTVRAQSAGGEVNEETFRHITNRLMCQCGGCSYLVLSCNHINCSSATYISKTVRNALAEGQTEEMILASLADQYGPRVLAEPPREGFTWLGWIMPYVALLLGGGVVALVLWRWKGSVVEEEGEGLEPGDPGIPPPPPEQAAALVAKYRAEIDRELDQD
ncbi:MAG: cytochrome c-type biogenesis protein CcmH [Acidobacteria bacterium]|nr:cytochrome c-type biogenesis protein CcmH [Acidobacteriota bacterium]